MVNVSSGSVASAGIVIDARMRAIERFKQLSVATGVAGRSMLGLAGRVFMLAGRLTLIGTAVSLLMHPVTGLIGLINVGLATRSWLLFETASRRARTQLGLLGLDTARTNEVLGTMRRILGGTAATEMFNNRRAVMELGRVSEAWQIQILETSVALGLASIDAKDFAAVASAAVRGVPGAYEELLRLYPELEGKVDNAQEALALLRETAEKESDLTNIEKLGKESDRLLVTTGEVIGPIADAITEIPLSLVTAINESIDLLKGFIEFTGGFLNIMGTIFRMFMGGIIGSVILLVTGKKDDIVAAWKGVVSDIEELWNNFIAEFLPTWFTDMTTKLKNWGDNVFLPWWNRLWAAVGTTMNQIINTDMPGTFGGFGETPTGGIAGDFINFLRRNYPDLLDQIRRTPSSGGADIGIAGFAHGGTVSGPLGKPQLAVLHGGETVIPTGGSPSVINIYIGDRKIDTVLLDSLNRITRQAGIVPRGVTSA